MRDPWRRCLPCGHHYWSTWHTNPAEKRHQCRNCGKHFPEDAIIDKKEEGAPPL